MAGRAPSFALAARSLRVDARSGRLALLRAALVALLGLIVAVAHGQSSAFGAPGLHLASRMLHLDFVLLTILGIAGFSAAIAEEREQQSLGLLALAGFGPLSTLLGTSLAWLVRTLLLLAMQLPFAMLAITLGGVSAHQLAAGWLLLAAWTAALFGAALFASARCATVAGAARLTLLLVVLLLGVLPVAHGLASATGAAKLADALQPFAAATAYTALHATTTTGYEAPLLNGSVVAHVLFGLFAFAGAWLHLRRAAHVETVSASGSRRRRFRPDAGAAAVRWKEFEFHSGGRRGMALRVGVYVLIAVVAVGSTASPAAAMDEVAGWTTIALLVEAVAGGSRLFGSELRQRTLGLLWLLPQEPSSWVGAKLSALCRTLLPGALACIGAHLLLASHRPLDGTVLTFALLLSGLAIGTWSGTLFGLVAPRAALPLALVTTHLTLLVVSGLVLVGLGNGGTGPLAMVLALAGLTAVIVFVLHVVARRRLRQAVAL